MTHVRNLNNNLQSTGVAMKIKQKIILFLYYILFIQCISWEVGFSQNLQGKIKLELSADTNVFVWGEYIWVDVSIVNLLNQEVSVPDLRSHARIHITDEHGNRVQGPIIDAFMMVYVPVPPKSSIAESFNVEHWNDKTEDSPGTRLLPGTYSARAVLMDVSSNILRFKVVPPSPEQRLVAREIANKIRKWRPAAQRIQDAKALLRQFPHTVYLSNIYYWLLVLLTMSDNPTERSDELVRYALEYLEKFPNRGEAQVALSCYISGLRNKLGIERDQKATPQQWRIIESELQKIKSRFPDERIARYIEQTIKYHKVQ